MINFQEALNSEQLDVVQNGDGPCLVLAGAGSGKTRVITYRVAYLLEKGVDPENILLVTFTNKAAGEMADRVLNLTGREEKLPWAGTFHHIGHKMLRKHATELGYKLNFTVLDSDDSESLVKLAAKDYAINTKGAKFPSAGVIHSIISMARNTEATINDIVQTRYPNLEMWEEQLVSIADNYAKKKREANAMDFDDLLVNALALLNIPALKEKYTEQFKYILVDEYQDTNRIQSAFILRLTEKHKNLLVVGDDAQSIYSFRGADIENILSFEKNFPDAKIFRLETNYRSSQEILSLANAVIANNPKQYKKNLKTIIKSGVKPILHPQPDQVAEAMFITERVLSLIKSGVPESEIAVLFRAAHHSQALELELMRSGIDYDYRGGTRFFDRSHVKDVLAYLRVFFNPSDTTAWLRVLLFEEGVGPASAGKIVEWIKLHGDSAEWSEVGYLLSEKARAGWSNFLYTYQTMAGIGATKPQELVRFIVTQYRRNLDVNSKDGLQRLDDLNQLAVFAARYEALDKFLADAALQEAFKLENDKKNKEKLKEGKIVLSTVHQSKGLEWSAVFVVNLTHGGFPNDRALTEDKGVEEERRLFYVAVTRAKKHLYLTYPFTKTANSRNNYNAWGEVYMNEPSIFLSEMDSDLIEDRSFGNNYSSTAFNDGDVTYVPEDGPSTGFLRSLDNL